jgi:anti-sigma-K factor RskA
MKIDELQKKLTAAARMQAPDDRVPYAFEKRIVALVKARGAVDRWAFWAQGLWRAAVMCVAVAAVVSAVSYFVLSPAPDSAGDLSQEFENTLLASADQLDVSQMP